MESEIKQQMEHWANILYGRTYFHTQVVRAESPIYSPRYGRETRTVRIMGSGQRRPLSERWHARRELHTIYDSSLDSEVRALAAHDLHYTNARLWFHEHAVLPMRHHLMGY